MQIPPWPRADERETELLRMVLESPQWGGFHPFVAEFEQSFAAYQHARYGIGAMNGSVTLELALEVLGVEPAADGLHGGADSLEVGPEGPLLPELVIIRVLEPVEEIGGQNSR